MTRIPQPNEYLRQKIARWWDIGRLDTAEMAKLAHVKEHQIERHLHSILAHRRAVQNSLKPKVVA